MNNGDRTRRTPASGSPLMVAHAHTQLPVVLLKCFFCMTRGSYVPTLVKIGPQITSQSRPQTPDGRLHDSIFCPMLRIALHSTGQTETTKYNTTMIMKYLKNTSVQCRRKMRPSPLTFDLLCGLLIRSHYQACTQNSRLHPSALC